ncbi:Reverse transcriptase (RNA-dependent DNA polymerase), putative [Entamoeba histolytica]
MNVISQINEEKFPKSNHTLYMDDLRIMTESSEEMGMIHNEIKEIISGIGMEMNEKKSGMVLKNNKEIPNGMQNIPIIEGDDLYKYLGIWQSDEIEDTFNCKTIKEKMMKKMEEINSDESSNRRYITRINTEVIPIFRYSASVVNWKITDLDKIDLEIRK